MTEEQKKPTFDYHLTYTDEKGKKHHKIFINLLYRERYVMKHFAEIVRGECSINYLNDEPTQHEYSFVGGANGGQYKNLDLEKEKAG